MLLLQISQLNAQVSQARAAGVSGDRETLAEHHDLSPEVGRLKGLIQEARDEAAMHRDDAERLSLELQDAHSKLEEALSHANAPKQGMEPIEKAKAASSDASCQVHLHDGERERNEKEQADLIQMLKARTEKLEVEKHASTSLIATLRSETENLRANIAELMKAQKEMTDVKAQAKNGLGVERQGGNRFSK